MAEQNLPSVFTGKKDTDDVVREIVHLLREAGGTHPPEVLYEAVQYVAAKMTHDLEHTVPQLPSILRRALAMGTFLRGFHRYLEVCNSICDAEQTAAYRRAQGGPEYDA